MSQRTYDLRRKAKQCVLCGGAPRPGKKKCEDCAQRIRDRINTKRAAARAKGLCHDCQKRPMYKAARCKIHYAVYKLREDRRKRKHAPLMRQVRAIKKAERAERRRRREAAKQAERAARMALRLEQKTKRYPQQLPLPIGVVKQRRPAIDVPAWPDNIPNHERTERRRRREKPPVPTPEWCEQDRRDEAMEMSWLYLSSRMRYAE